MNGKGDRYRPVDPRKWSENYDRIYGASVKKLFPSKCFPSKMQDQTDPSRKKAR
jgi:hypothetical protein